MSVFLQCSRSKADEKKQCFSHLPSYADRANPSLPLSLSVNANKIKTTICVKTFDKYFKPSEIFSHKLRYYPKYSFLTVFLICLPIGTLEND